MRELEIKSVFFFEKKRNVRCLRMLSLFELA